MWLGIDIGTSSVKLSLLNDAGDEVATATSPLTVQTPHPYWSERTLTVGGAPRSPPATTLDSVVI